MAIKVLKTEYHRNGIGSGGVGFHTILFEADEENVTKQYMATVFPARHPEGKCEVCDYFGKCPDAFNGMVAILDTDSMISWASNQNEDSYISNWPVYRGDYFERSLRQWLWDDDNNRGLDQGFDSIKYFKEWKQTKQTQELNKDSAESFSSENVPYAPI